MNTATQPSPARKLIPGLIIACLILMGLLAWMQEQATALNAENTDLKKSLDASEKHLRLAEADSARWHQQADSLLGQSGRAAPAANSAGTAAATEEHKRNLHPEEVTAMVTSQGMQSVIASQQSALTAMAYKDLLDRLKLSPQERDYMQKLLVDKQMVQVSNGMQMMDPSLSPDDRAALGQKIGQGMAADDAKIQDFLNNDADYASYQSYSKQETERTEIGMFESSLTGDNAIDPATADSLASVLADTRQNFPFTVDFYNKANFANPAVLNAPTVNKFLDEQAQYQAQVADKAATILNPTQLQAFKQNQAAMRQMTKMQMSNIVQLSGGQ